MKRSGLLRGQNLESRKFLKQTTLILAFVFVLALFHVWVRMQVVETGYQIRKLTEEQEALKGEHHNLKVEVATLRSPVRLEAIAKEMGLKKPPEKQVLLISSRIP